MRAITLGICILTGILILSGIVMFAGNGGSATVTELKFDGNSRTLTSHAPIYIDSNADFSNADDDGVSNPGAAGTASDPYVIENWDIDASTASGIFIGHYTNVYFIIRNCVIHDGSSNYGIYFYGVINGKIDNIISYSNRRGIMLEYSSNNNITNCAVYNNSLGIYLDYSSNNNAITNCAVYNNNDGIALYESSNNNISNCAVYNNNDVGISLSSSNNNQITNCAVYNNSYGIPLWDSSNNNITNCYVYNNSGWYGGIYLYSSSNNNITNCDVYDNSNYGIYLYSSSNNILRANILGNNKYNLVVYSEGFSCYYQDIDTSNTINGKPIYYITNQSGLAFNNTMSIGYLGLVSCTNIKVENLTLINNGPGLLLANISYSTITNCAVYNNSYGIHLWDSSNNNITNCAVYNNFLGIYQQHFSNNNTITNCNVYNNSYGGIVLEYSSNNNTITNCAVYNNSWYGIELSSSSNTEIHYSNIYDNEQYGVYTDGYTVNATYNWWGYASGPGGVCLGSGDNVSGNVLYDPWLTEPVSKNHPPVVNSITANPTTVNTGGTVTITVNDTDEDVGDTLTYHYSCTGGTISGSGSTVTWTAPSTAGNYTITVYVNDGKVNSNSKSVTVTVTSVVVNHAPIVNSITANPTTVSTSGTVTITIDASDADVGDTLTYYYDCTGGTISGSSSTVTWTAPNTAGDYTVTVYVNDSKVNSNSKSVSITVTTIVTDSDGDGHPDNEDAFPNNPSEWKDTDGDDVGDNTDKYPNDPNKWKEEEKKEKGFIPGFETFLLLIVFTGYATVGIRRRKKAQPPEKPVG